MTLYASFFEEVLVLTRPPNNLRPPNIDMGAKGKSTQKAIAPVVWFERLESDYVRRADGIIENKRIKDELLRSYLPAPYSPCILNTETDIVQASVLWLLHPVIKALQALFPNVECAAEVTVGDCRCDALITIGGRHIAVLEYKNRGNLHEKEFKAGLVADFSPAHRPAVLARIDAGTKTRYQSAMGESAACLTKQAMAYATRWETRYVGLFDWDSLFLWNFAGVCFGPDKPCQWAYGTWVKDRKNYRSALLGFVLEAYNSRMDPRFNVGSAAPFELTAAQKAALREKRKQQMTPQQQANQQIFGRR